MSKTNKQYIEPAHEALIRTWDRVLMWQKDEKDFLPLQRATTEAMLAWQQQRGSLWNAERRLNDVLKRWKRDPYWLSAKEGDFALRSRQWRRVLKTSVSVVGTVALLFILLFVVQSQSARRQAEARALAAQAESVLSARPDALSVSTMLAVESLRLNPSLDARRVLAANLTLLPIADKEMQHGGVINALAATQDGTILASAGDNHFACLWNVATGQEIARLPHSQRVTQILLSPDATRVVTISNFAEVTLWNKEGEGKYRSITLRRSETSKSNPSDVLFVHDIALSPDGNFLAVAAQPSPRDPAPVRIYDLPTWTQNSPTNRSWTVPVHGLGDTPAESGTWVRFHKDGTHLMTATGRGVVEIWSRWQTGSPKRDAPFAKPFSLLIETAGRGSPQKPEEVQFAESDPEFHFLSVVGSQTAQAIRLEYDERLALGSVWSDIFVEGTALSPQDLSLLDNSGYPLAMLQYMAQSGWNRPDIGTPGLKIYELYGTRAGRTVFGIGEARQLQFAVYPELEKAMLLMANSATGLHIYRVVPDELDRPQLIELARIVHDPEVTAFCPLPTKSLLATASHEGTIRLWSLQSELSPARFLVNNRESPRAVTFQNNDSLFACGKSGTLTGWHLPDGLPYAPMKLPGSMALLFSANGKRVVWNAPEGVGFQNITLTDSKHIGEELHWLQDTTTVKACAVSPDGEAVGVLQLARTAQNESNTLRVFRVMSGDGTEKEILHQEGLPDGKILAVAPHGDYMAFVGTPTSSTKADSTVQLWHLPGGNGQLPRSLAPVRHAASASITAVAFSPTEHYLATADDQGTLNVWAITPQKTELRAVQRFTQAVLTLAFDPASNHLACATIDKRIHVFALNSNLRLPVLRRFSSPSLALEEVLVFQSDRCPVALAFDAAGKRMVAIETYLAPQNSILPNMESEDEETLRLYPLREEDMIAAARARIVRPLTSEQSQIYFGAPNHPPTFPAGKSSPAAASK